MPEIGIGLIGSDFMGAAIRMRCMPSGIFDLPVEPVMEMLADVNEAVVAEGAKGLTGAKPPDAMALLSNMP